MDLGNQSEGTLSHSVVDVSFYRWLSEMRVILIDLNLSNKWLSDATVYRYTMQIDARWYRGRFYRVGGGRVGERADMLWKACYFCAKKTNKGVPGQSLEIKYNMYVGFRRVCVCFVIHLGLYNTENELFSFYSPPHTLYSVQKTIGYLEFYTLTPWTTTCQNKPKHVRLEYFRCRYTTTSSLPPVWTTFSRFP